MLLLPILLPFFGGLFMFYLDIRGKQTQSNQQGQNHHGCPSNQNMAFLLIWATAITVVICSVFFPEKMVFGYLPYQLYFSLKVDSISLFFAPLFVGIWLIVLKYATSYMAHDEEKNRFYASYVSLLGAMLGLCYANNLLTFYLFFELVSLCCVTLVVQEQTEDAVLACKKFFYYSMAGAFLAMVSVFYFSSFARLGISMDFVAGGIPELWDVGNPSYLLGFTLLAFVGFGCKAGMFPLHGWLKTAHPIAPAPASAVLSAITTKAGVLAILRILYYVVGVAELEGTYVQRVGLTLALLTIFMGSMLAYRERVLKTRLAYSTVSQVSYVLFGLLVFREYAFVGAMLQVLFHATAKTLLFLCAGTMIHETGFRKVDDFHGIGRQLPNTFALFTVASLSLVGVPFTGGLISKWYLSVGVAEQSNLGLSGVAVIMTSALLTGGYLLPICVNGYFSERNLHKLKQIPFKGEKITYLLAIVIVVLGTFPVPLVELLLNIAQQVGLGGGL